MSIASLMLRDLMAASRQLRHLDHFFHPNEFFAPFIYPTQVFRNEFNPFVHKEANSAVFSTKDKCQILVDMQQFSPNEIMVKTVDGNSVIVEAKHEDKPDEQGSVSRHFVRKFVLPSGHDITKIVSNLSKDGVLTITAPKTEIEQVNEKIIPIIHEESSK